MTVATASPPTLPALVEGHVTHRRAAPIRHRFRHRSYLWLVDLDRLPRRRTALHALTGFHASDHLGGNRTDASASIRSNVERFLAGRGVDLTGGRVLMLTHPRALGYVFNPLTVYWCFAADGALRCVVAEVHNTYGDVHAYLVTPDSEGRAHAAKEMYVSPFNDVSGSYAMNFALDTDRVTVSVALHRNGEPAFEASFEGAPRPATRRAVWTTALRLPLMPLRVPVLIRLHGVWLWLRRLPVVARPRHPRREGV